MRIAFYAPTIASGHDMPSGDRRMAELLKKVLACDGHIVATASNLRSRSSNPDPSGLDALKRQAGEEQRRLISRFAGANERPHLWLTYHPYYKAPDLIGPPVAAELEIPYVTAEASFAGKRAKGEWAPWHEASLPALSQAACHFFFTERDKAGLAAAGVDGRRLMSLPPFIDAAPFATVAPRMRAINGPVELVTLAMMRGGRKLESYRHLAASLALLGDIDWRLTVCGDGPEREAVAQAFSVLPAGRINFPGRVEPEAVPSALARGDLFVWPGIGEAYGLCYLEAQAAGLPCIAYDSGGTAASIEHEHTGLLVREGDIAGLAAAIRRLAFADDLRQAMAGRARRHVFDERSLAASGQRIAPVIATLTRSVAVT